MKGRYYLDNTTKIHGALLVAHIFSIIGRGVEVVTTNPSKGGGVASYHPLQWAFLRNFGASLVFLLGSSLCRCFGQHDNVSFDDNGKPVEQLTPPQRRRRRVLSWKTNWKSFALVGLVLFGIQGGLILGTLLTGSTTAARFWHPIGLMITAWFIRLFGWESHQSKRYRGVAIATVGCWILAVLSRDETTTSTTTLADANDKLVYSILGIIKSIISSLFGHYFLFIQSACVALYMCYSKVLLALYPPLVVTAGTFSFATIYMLVFWMILSIILPNNSDDFFCPQCTSATTNDGYDPADDTHGVGGYLLFLFHRHVLPRALIPAMIYDSLFSCVVAYGILTWANQYCSGTLVMSYTLLQPVIVILLTMTLKDVPVPLGCGMAAVVYGLHWINSTEQSSNLYIIENEVEGHQQKWEETLPALKKKAMPEGPFVSEVVRIGDYDICLHTFTSATTNSSSDYQPKAVVVFLHGWNSHGTYPTTRMLAELVLSKGYAFVAPDMPGHGVSSGTPGYVGRGNEVSQVTAATIEHIHRIYNNPEKSSSSSSSSSGGNNNSDNKQQPHRPLKVFVVGSSMGGNLALQGALRCCNVSGVVLLAPMLRLRPMGPLRPLLKFYRMIFPMIEFIPMEKMINYRCPKVQKAVEDDPFKPHQEGDRVLIRSVASLAELTDSLDEQFKDVTCSLLVMIADEDKVVDNEGAFDLVKKAQSKDVVVKHYPALHGLMGEPSPLIDRIQNDLISWLDERHRR